ncbi:MAG: AI-2E family transporter [Pseudobdellovibrionaceae bacterium]
MNPSQIAIDRERKLKLFFFLCTLLLLVAAIVMIKNVFVSFLLAFVTYFVMAPIVDFLERRGLSRSLATTFPFLILVIILIVLGQIFFPVLSDQINSLKTDFPKYLDASTKFVTNLESQANTFMEKIYPVDLRGNLQPKVMNLAQGFFTNLPDFISQSLTIFFLAPFLAFFMLLDGRDFVRRILALVPNHYFELALNLNHQISAQMGGFIRARILESVLIAFVIWVGLILLGFPYALILAVFAGVMNVIPYLGPFIGAAPALVICLANAHDSSTILWIVFIYALAQVLDIILIIPFVVAKIVDLHPVTVVLAVIVGSQLLGILGMIISIPLFSALKVSTSAIYKHLTDFRS